MRKTLLVCYGVFCLTAVLQGQVSQSCTPAFSKVELDINNVRAMIMSGGDLWWDLSSPKYEIPKGSGANSLFCGSIWMGGMDQNGLLHVSAGTYRQSGNDFWSGPLDTLSAGVIDSTCEEYDQLWKINRAEVESFITNRDDPNYVMPDVIRDWPAHGNTARGISRWLAPFTDVNGDLVYDPYAGDFPGFNFSGQNNCNNDLLGDQAIWWVFNDKGNVHGETGSPAFGMEIQATAFAYRSSNASLDNATFYRYKVINRSTTTYSDIWFANWWDMDLGDAFDDFIGCDVGRGLGYAYNGDSIDGASPIAAPGTYGVHPPAIGLDYLGGPFAEPGDGMDNDRDSVIDEVGEQIYLAGSSYYEGDFSVKGNPENGPEYYYYLHHHWKDDSPLTYGGTGYGGTVECAFIFPGDSDPYGWGTGGIPQAPWYDLPPPGDRRQLNSVGPFTMNPGEVEVITIGIPWARDMNGNNLDAIDRLREADDYIQALFDNCFSIPCVDQQVPDITCVIDDKLACFTLYATGSAWSWDFGDGQTSTQKHPSHYYMEPGDYTVCVQVTTPCGNLSDCDTIHIDDQLLSCGPEIWRIEGQGNGKQLLEFTKESIDISLRDTVNPFPVYTSMHGPVKISYEDYDALLDGEYRLAFDSTHSNAHWKMWRVDGTDTVYSDTTISSGQIQRIALWGLGVQIMQVPNIGYDNNPDRNGMLSSTILFADHSRNWLTGIADSDQLNETNWIRSGVRQGSGMCIADFNDRFNGVNGIDEYEHFEQMVGATWAPYRLCAYAPSPTQMTICYTQGPAWAPSPVSATVSNKIENLANVDVVITSDQSLWTRCPVIETGPFVNLNEGQREIFHLRSGLSVDKNGLNVNNGGLSDPSDPDAADFIGATGMGWFPGYAINLETGERLNMAFGENSAYVSERGRDMLWNPTENEITPLAGPLWGGCHYIYVFGHNGNAIFTSGILTGELKDIPAYDGGQAMFRILNADVTANPELREVYADAMWTTIPVLNPGHALFETDVTVKLRVQKPYAKFATSTAPQNNDHPLYGFRINKLDLCCNGYDGAVLAYPNPFSDECIIQFDNRDYHRTDLKLYDAQGRLVRLYDDVTTDRIVISGAGLYSGVYIYSLEMEGENPRTGRLVFHQY